MSAPASCACRVSSTASLALVAAVHAWMTTAGSIARASSIAISVSLLRSSIVSDHHSAMPLVSHSIGCRRSPTQ